ncbi:50S ribosomal protein L2 [Candidatus Collierbacteria bacterium CG09_land_8_20_14_0_10_46_12]|uniref:Large ribosomal subunit protein uL2 n=2 Tax=Candidatus Collieribacteriota TaxID=1752725 RepID=A0A2H0X1N6_9BACT|nr:MAG: 50S ribosomal protein L2 [Candidatus Collierbacteria bacterium CG09_land_8_20_14_0_10_46_12]
MLKPKNPTSAGVRHQVNVERGLTTSSPEKSLTSAHKKITGRNAHGHVTTRHRGGGEKRRYRIIDYKRNKKGVEARVVSIEYDPGRSANIALLYYRDGEKRYILAPDTLAVDMLVVSGPEVEPRVGNALPLKKIPIGMPIHNLELKEGRGGQIVRSAGTIAMIQSKEGDFCTVKLPSGEIRLIKGECFATIGQVSNLEHKNRKIGKAGRKRHMGWRPSVRGIAQHPDSHPHGGGEGRSGIGMPSPKTPWGKPALGYKTRNKSKYSNKYIVKDRRAK